MAQAEPSYVTASCDDEDGGTGVGIVTMSMSEIHCGVAGDECVTSSASLWSSAESCDYVTAGMSQEQISAAIEISREQGWSELRGGTRDGAAEPSHASSSARDIWEELKIRDPRVFMDRNEDQLKLGRVIAEGGQALIYEASLGGYGGYVAKVFKMEGFSLADLQLQWPRTTKRPPRGRKGLRRGMNLGGVVFGEIIHSCNSILCGTILKDGRFAFVMPRCWGDLRTLINLKLKDMNSHGPPFSHAEAVHIMHDIAEGMRDLHVRGVLHRDLKAANVLIKRNSFSKKLSYNCKIADYESSLLVQGTQFWRAPEVLKELLRMPHDRNEGIWTEKVDIYSYAMTCYEVLTGHIPFYGFKKNDWNRVIDGERPHLPDYVDARLQKLVERCWHAELSKRPSFEVIEAELAGLDNTNNQLVFMRGPIKF